MFSDIKAFSALMARDEQHTIALVREHRAIVRECLAERGGQERGTEGDSFFVLFDSAVNAVRCAMDIQQRLAERNASRVANDHVVIRIGIHLGDIVVDSEEGQVYGDGVNIAARTEPLALPGGICITEDVHHQIKGKLDARMVSIGRPPMKNIADPPEVFRIVMGSEPPEMEPAAREHAVGSERSGPRSLRRVQWLILGVGAVVIASALGARVLIKSCSGGDHRAGVQTPTPIEEPGKQDRAKEVFSTVVVLPFENVTGLESLEWLGVGLAQGIEDRLEQSEILEVHEMPSAKVVAALAEEHSGDALLVSVGEQVGARWVVGGSYVVVGDQIKVTGRVVIVAEHKTHRVVEKTGRVDGVLKLQGELIASLIEDLPIEIRDEASLQKARASTLSEEAFAAYAKARTIYRRDRGWNETNMDEGIRLLTGALELDPGFIRARVLLASVYHHRWQLKASMEDHDLALAQSKEVLDRQPDNVQSLLMMCRIHHENGENETALSWCDKAREIDLELGDNHYVAWVYEAVGKFDEAEQVLLRMIERDPDVSWIRANTTEFYLRRGRLDDALVHSEECARLQDLDVELGAKGPTVKKGWFESFGCHALHGKVLFELEKFDEAKAAFEKEVQQAEGRPHVYKLSTLVECHTFLVVLLAKVADEQSIETQISLLVSLLDKVESQKLDAPSAFNDAAWFLATKGQADERLLAFALELALKAVALSGRDNANILDTLAEVHERRGETVDARKINQEGLNLDPNNESLIERKARLGQ